MNGFWEFLRAQFCVHLIKHNTTQQKTAQIMKMTFSIHDFLSKHIIQVCGIDHQLREKIVLIFIFTWSSFYSLFVSLLSHFWLIHLFYLHLLYQPYVGLCQATRVQSHQPKRD